VKISTGTVCCVKVEHARVEDGDGFHQVCGDTMEAF